MRLGLRWHLPEQIVRHPARWAERGRFIILEVSSDEQVPGLGATRDERFLEKGGVKDGRIVAGDGEPCQEVGRPE